MQPAIVASLTGEEIPENTLTFYQAVLNLLNKASLPYLIGGAYALNHYTGINRCTRDFDIFITRQDYPRISAALIKAGFQTELTYPHWLAKTRCQDDFIDLVFSSGNGIAEVDQAWFDYASAADVFGIPAKMCPAEEMIWSKAFIMERERFDGADVAHLILACGAQLDWRRLLRRLDPHWRLLFSHLTLFGFIYPAHRDVIPTWLMGELLARIKQEMRAPTSEDEVCGGTLLSREQYLNDIAQWGYQDARLAQPVNMTERDIALWTEAIKNKTH